jgi:cell division protein FtsB
LLRYAARTMTADSRSGNSKILRILMYIAGGLLLLLQYPLWFGSGGVFAVWQLNRESAAQQADNAHLRDRNHALDQEVKDLKQGSAAIEERARAELGMVKKGETFYQVIGNAPAPDKNPATPATR